MINHNYDFGNAATRIQSWYRQRQVARLISVASNQYINYCNIIQDMIKEDLLQYNYNLQYDYIQCNNDTIPLFIPSYLHNNKNKDESYNLDLDNNSNNLYDNNTNNKVQESNESEQLDDSLDASNDKFNQHNHQNESSDPKNISNKEINTNNDSFMNNHDSVRYEKLKKEALWLEEAIRQRIKIITQTD